MAKFLILWEVETTKIPDNPKEMFDNWTKMLNMVKKDFESKTPHKIDWGLFASHGAGYSIYEGTEQDIALGLLKYVPYVKFKVYPVLSVDQGLEMVKKMSQA